MPLELILLIAALIVSWLAFTLLVKVLKATVSTALAIAAILLVLQIAFGIGPQQLFDQITQLPQTVWQTLTGKEGDRPESAPNFLDGIIQLPQTIWQILTGKEGDRPESAPK